MQGIGKGPQPIGTRPAAQKPIGKSPNHVARRWLAFLRERTSFNRPIEAWPSALRGASPVERAVASVGSVRRPVEQRASTTLFLGLAPPDIRRSQAQEESRELSRDVKHNFAWWTHSCTSQALGRDPCIFAVVIP